MDYGICRDSNIISEEIQVLNAISLVSSRIARKLVAFAQLQQSEEGGKYNEQDKRYGSAHQKSYRAFR